MLKSAQAIDEQSRWSLNSKFEMGEELLWLEVEMGGFSTTIHPSPCSPLPSSPYGVKPSAVHLMHRYFAC
uniref:Uncharacterized protein n=1 Tax=Oryza nivara TaxID=4536 RepID=A0A0E0FR18_ORYNI